MSNTGIDTLIGYEFDSDSGRLRIVGLYELIPGYVRCEFVNSTRPDTVRSLSQVLRARELEASS